MQEKRKAIYAAFFMADTAERISAITERVSAITERVSVIAEQVSAIAKALYIDFRACSGAAYITSIAIQ